MTTAQSQTEANIQHTVVVNHEKQYSIWPTHKDLPGGWTATGYVGTREDCLAYIKQVWTDMRPLSVRNQSRGPGS
jgi:MbtH protein